MSSQTLDHIPDISIELDLETELTDDEIVHALVFCPDHAGSQWMPVTGTIVQVVCGKLLRQKNDTGTEMCGECMDLIETSITKCYVCGRKTFRT